MKLSENDVKLQVLDWLTLKRILHYRNNVAAFTVEGRFVRCGTPGLPDIICIIEGKFVGIELKAPGKKQTTEQVHWEQLIKEAKGHYFLCHSLEDVIRQVEEILNPQSPAHT